MVSKMLHLLQPLAGSSSSKTFSSTSEAEVQRIHEDLAYVQQTLESIEVILEEAERREVQDESIRLWLTELLALADAANDLLDLYQYEAVASEVRDREEVKTLGKRKSMDDQVCISSKTSLCSPLGDPKFRRAVAGRAKKIRDRFHEIDMMKDALDLKDCGEVKINRSITDRTPAGSLPVEAELIGREVELQRLVDVLTGATDNHVQVPEVVALVGMGGVGKTTLAQYAFNKPEVENHFHIIKWVSVSDEFELVSLSEKVLQAFTINGIHLTELSAAKLRIQVEGKKFLLVLDDIWNDDSIQWQNFLSWLPCGATGSKVLVTTRSHAVAKTTQAVEEIQVDCLSEEDACSLFLKCAFRSSEISQDYSSLVAIGREIAKKCNGLPLALKVLGSRLSYDLDNQSAWHDVLESDIWDNHVWDDGKLILGPLLLSYLHLPAYLKPCLKLCSVFAKHTWIDYDDLVSLWVVHDKVVIKDRDNWMDLEAMAWRHIRELTSRSFLQPVDSDKYNPNVHRVAMHDLIHDLIQFLTQNEHNGIAGEGGMRALFLTSGSFPDHQNSERLRTLCYGKKYNVNTLFLNSFVISKNLRSVRLYVYSIERTNMERIFKCYNLRQLEIDMRSREKVPIPESIGNLKHLLSLSLSPVYAQELPESLFRLPKLQHLSLEQFFTKETFTFPENISNLTSLQSFGIHNAGIFQNISYYLPAGFGRLRN